MRSFGSDAARNLQSDLSYHINVVEWKYKVAENGHRHTVVF